MKFVAIRVLKAVPIRNAVGVVTQTSNPSVSHWINWAKSFKYPITDQGIYLEILASY